MKSSSVVNFVAGLVFVSLSASADNSVNESEILAQRGNGIVTQATFTARANKIPAEKRLSTLRDSNRMRDILNKLLLYSQLAADAREAGFDKEKMIVNRMQLVAELELAEAWLQHYITNITKQSKADFEMLAREYYQVNKQEMLSDAKINVSHILVSTREHTPEEAIELADSIYRQLASNPAIFDDLVMKYSEDESVSSNQGKFKGVSKGDMVKTFEKTAFALQAGQISTPVKTEYGYHIIRLDAHIAPQQLTYDEVSERLITRERKRHEERIRGVYMDSLTTIDVKMTKNALEEMVKRQFGEEYIELQTDGADSE